MARPPTPPQHMARPPTPQQYQLHQHPGMVGMQGNQTVYTYQLPPGSMGGPVPISMQYHLIQQQPQQPQPYPSSGQRGPAPGGGQVMTPGAPSFNPGGPYGGSAMPVQYPPHSHPGQMGSAGQPSQTNIIYSGGPPSLNMNMQQGHPGMAGLYGPRFQIPQHMMSQQMQQQQHMQQQQQQQQQQISGPPQGQMGPQGVPQQAGPPGQHPPGQHPQQPQPQPHIYQHQPPRPQTSSMNTSMNTSMNSLPAGGPPPATTPPSLPSGPPSLPPQNIPSQP